MKQKCSLYIAVMLISINGYTQSWRQFLEVKGDSMLIKEQQGNSRVVKDQYYNWYNFTIPKYYQIKDSLIIEDSGKRTSGALLILSPRLEDSELIENKFDSPINKRLLLYFEKEKALFKLVEINHNLIPDRQNYPSEPFEGISGNAHQIKLRFYTGSSRKCELEFVFSSYRRKFMLTKSIVHCYLIDLSKQDDWIKAYKPSTRNNLGNINLIKIISDINNNLTF